MKSDKTFYNRIMAIEDVAERFNLIKSDGFDCSEAEIKEVAGELSDEDLEAAAGGDYALLWNRWDFQPGCK